MRLTLLVTSVLAATGLTACGNAKKSGTSSNSGASSNSGTSTGTTQAGQVIVATNLSDLQLSQSLNAQPSATVSGTGDQATVTQAGTVQAGLFDLLKKSKEVCQIRDNARGSMQALAGIARELCHVEAESAQAPFGKKIRIPFVNKADNTNHTYSIFVDNGTTGKLDVNLCLDDKLATVFIVTAAQKGGMAKATFRSTGSNADVSWQVEGLVDRVSKPGHHRLATKAALAAAGDTSIRQHVIMDLDPTGISVVTVSAIAEAATAAGNKNSLSLSGTGRFGPHFGNALMHYDVEGGDSGSSVKANLRAFFDGQSRLLPKAASAAFSREGFVVKATELIKPLAATYEPAALGGEFWDCSGTTDVKASETPDHAAACEQIGSTIFAKETCDSAEYGAGDVESLDPAAFGDGVNDFSAFDGVEATDDVAKGL